jgi:hypothetical protein
MSRLIVALALLAALPCPAPACDLCAPGVKTRDTFREEMARATLVIYGKATGSRLAEGGLPGAGATDFQIERILKADPFVTGKATVQLNTYVPILDPRDLPRLVVFGDVVNGKLDAYQGRHVKSAAIVEYLEGARAFEKKDRAEALGYYARFLDHTDESVAEDAFLEFVRSKNAEIGQAAKKLDPEKLRALLQNPKVNQNHLSLFAFLLGACGKDRDAQLLRKLIDQPDDRTRDALDGLLAGYVHLDKRAGWDLANKILNDPKQSFQRRFAVIRTVRFWYGWQPAECKAEVLRCYSALLEDGSMADMPVEHLRRWELWDLTDKVLAQYGRPSHDSPILSRNILRYAIACPLPAARAFVENIQRRDPDLVRELREILDLEK